MKQGKYFQIPECPTDIERAWRESELLTPNTRPAWLEPGDVNCYRYWRSAALHGLAPAYQSVDYIEEVEQMNLAGLIVEPVPGTAAECHVLIPMLKYPAVWSIGIYEGDSPVNLAPLKATPNPVLTRDDVTDVTAVFVADPFMVRSANAWFMFFEVLNWQSNKGEIGFATSNDGLKWAYQQIVLAEEFHLSYPYVFEWMNEFYMIPESYQAGAIRLYKAKEFPTHWTFVKDIHVGPYFVDTSVFQHDGKWWLFTETSAEGNHDTLRLFFSDDLLGQWLEHPESPLIKGDPKSARPAGRVSVYDDKVVRYAQSCYPSYGTQVRAFEVTELTTTNYREFEVRQSPILTPSGAGWNARGMHHLDAHPLNGDRWLACVDGWFSVGAVV